MELVSLLRWIHELTAISWFGEVFVLTHIIVPALGKMPRSDRDVILARLFPRVFRMATITSAATIFSGAATALLLTDFNLSVFVLTTWGQLILAAGLIGLFMFLLHLTVERVELMALGRVKLESRDEPTPELTTLYRRLRILPRLGFTLLTIVLILMIYVSHGL